MFLIKRAKSINIMNYRYLLLWAAIICIVPSCIYRTPVIDRFTGLTQGTTYSIVYDNNINITPELLKSRVDEILHQIDMSLSIYRDSSIISKVNRNEDVVLDSFFIDVFRKSVRISEMTGGAFDITVGPLVKAWGFGPDAHKNFSEAKRDSLIKLVGMDKVSLNGNRILKKVPGVYLDVNAIAQGYTVDVICRYFDRIGIVNYLVEVGGEVRAKGKKGGSLWRIGIDKPEDNNMIPGQELQAIIKLTDKSVSTSGNYRAFFVENGVKYAHTINPKTGYPAKNRLLSATIVARDCATADGIATACMVMGIDSAIDLINKNPQLGGYFVFSDDKGAFRTWISGSLRKSITEENKNPPEQP
jgi:FAD:protein FMN transferase